jgi:hypothetical protein
VSEKKPLYQSPGETGKRGFEDLECYQLALEVMAKIHAFSKTLPPDEKFDLYVQIRRSSKGITGILAKDMGVITFLIAYTTIPSHAANLMKHWPV